MRDVELEKRFEDCKERVSSLRKVVEYRGKVRKQLKESIEKLNKDYEEQKEYIDKLKRAKMYIQQITDERNEVKNIIKDLTVKALTSIRGEYVYDLIIEDDVRGEDSKITNIQLINAETGSPRKPGTAVKQITSFIFIAMLIEMSGSSRVMCLDEYLGGASGETASKLSDVLIALTNNNGFQFFVANHVSDISNNPYFVRLYFKYDPDEDGMVLDKDRTEKERKYREEQIEVLESENEGSE